MNLYKRQKREDLEMSNLNVFSLKKKENKVVRLQKDNEYVRQN